MSSGRHKAWRVIKWFVLVGELEWLLDKNEKGALADDQVVVETSRYLRLAMLALIVGLSASLLFELNRVQNDLGHACLLGSISAYYYTPVHSFFVGALVAIGVAMIALKGNTDLEDLLLNLSGAFAPFVALVPTDKPPTSCEPTLGGFKRDLYVANNVGALFVAGLAAFVALGVLGLVGYFSSKEERRPRALTAAAYGITLALFFVAFISFWKHRPWFLEFAHPISAVAMFAIIALNILLNGYNLYRAHKAASDPRWKRVLRSVLNRYTPLGLLMIIDALVIFFLVRPHLNQWVFTLEATEIGLFGLFWLLQTIELWNKGLRTDPTPSPPQAPKDPPPQADAAAVRVS
jgi:hypothetical protein